MRLLRLATLLLGAAMAACSASPTAASHRPGSARAESNPDPAPHPDTTNTATRGGNGFGSGN
jgi:hypothetical protein